MSNETKNKLMDITKQHYNLYDTLDRLTSEVGANSFVKVHLFLTDKCNLKCPTCFVDASGRFENELTSEEWRGVIKQLNEYQINEIHIEGGEPFLRDDLVDIIKNFKYHSHIVIATNGTIDYKPKYRQLKGIKRLSFSIESFYESHHRKIKNSNLEKVIGNIDAFKDAGFYVNTNSVLTSINYKDIPHIAKRCKELKIPMARFAMFEIVGRGLKHQKLRLNNEQYKKAVKLYFDAAEKYQGRIALTLGLPCYALDFLLPLSPLPNYLNIFDVKSPQQFAITADGSVYPCASLINSPEYKWGNVRDKELIEILFGKTFFFHPCREEKCGVDACCSYVITNETLFNKR